MKLVDGFQIDYNQQLGKGSFANVYACSNPKFQIPLCVKEIQFSYENQEQMACIQREIQILQYLEKQGNENIIRIVSVSYLTRDKTNYCYIFMERCLQGDLEKQFKLRKKLNKFYSIEEIIEKLEQIINGYQILYESNIIHRDLKPENLLIGNDKKIKISDFGFGRIFEKHQLSQQQKLSMVGTPRYASPQVLLTGIYSSKSDVYSLGIILYYMIFLDLPFKCLTFFELLEWQRTNLQGRVFNVPQFPQQSQNLELEKIHLKKFLENTITFDENNRFSWQEIFSLFSKNKKINLQRKSSVLLLSTQSSLHLNQPISEQISLIMNPETIFKLIETLQKRSEIISQLANYSIIFQEKYKQKVTQQELQIMLAILYGYQHEILNNEICFSLKNSKFCPEVQIILTINQIDEVQRKQYIENQEQRYLQQKQKSSKNLKIFQYYYQDLCKNITKFTGLDDSLKILVKQILSKQLDGDYFYFSQLFFKYYIQIFEPKMKLVLEIAQDIDTLIFFTLIRQFYYFQTELPLSGIEQQFNIKFSNISEMKEYIKNHPIK